MALIRIEAKYFKCVWTGYLKVNPLQCFSTYAWCWFPFKPRAGRLFEDAILMGLACRQVGRTELAVEDEGVVVLQVYASHCSGGQPTTFKKLLLANELSSSDSGPTTSLVHFAWMLGL